MKKRFLLLFSVIILMYGCAVKVEGSATVYVFNDDTDPVDVSITTDNDLVDLHGSNPVTIASLEGYLFNLEFELKRIKDEN